MTPPTRNRPPTLIVIAVAILFIVLAIVEAMAGELTPRASASAAAWMIHIGHIEDALAKRDVSDAERHWRDAYAGALGSRRWEGMIEVGDASLRIGEAAGSRKAAESRARWTYLAALFRARQEKSLDGVLRAAEAFSRLGDREVVAQCLRIAERLAAQSRNPQARERVTALSDRLTTDH